MRRYVLTGTPGAGKTAVLGALAARGLAVVPEAATDVVARALERGVSAPELTASFIDDIVTLQAERERTVPGPGALAQVHDRSVLCTLALARFLGRPVTPLLGAEVDRVTSGGVFERAVFWIQPIGFVTRTAVRKISYAQSLEFERLHEQAYAEYGFDLVPVPPGPVASRAAAVEAAIRARG